MTDDRDLKHGPHLQAVIPPVSKINKAIFRGQIAISAPLINFYPSTTALQPTKCKMKRLKCVSHNTTPLIAGTQQTWRKQDDRRNKFKKQREMGWCLDFLENGMPPLLINFRLSLKQPGGKCLVWFVFGVFFCIISVQVGSAKQHGIADSLVLRPASSYWIPVQWQLTTITVTFLGTAEPMQRHVIYLAAT